MAGQKQPIDLVVANGKKHLTKAEIDARKASEVKAGTDKVRAPTYLPKELKAGFNTIAKQLLHAKIMTNLDVDALARFVIARDMYNKLTEKILNNDAFLMDKDILGNQDKLFKQCRSAAMDLGLTIGSRCRLVVPIVTVEKPPNKYDRFR